MDNSKIIQHLRAMPTSDLMMQAADVIEQQDRLIEAIGAGGVSQVARLDLRERLTPYLRACEHAWWVAQKERTPESGRAFDDARERFWEAL